MARRKNAASLFEVIVKEKQPEQGLQVPAWAEGHAPGPPPAEPPVGQLPHAPVASAEEPESAPRQAPVAQVPPVHEAPMVAPSGPRLPLFGQPGERIVQVLPGRLRLNLNYISCGAIALGMLVLLVLAYSLGKMSGPRSVSPPAEKLVPEWERRNTELASRLKNGAKYLRIQSNVDSLDDALETQKYLSGFGIEPAIMGAQPPFTIYDTKDYSASPADQLEGIVNHLQQLGQRGEWKLKNKYTFRQPGPPVRLWTYNAQDGSFTNER